MRISDWSSDVCSSDLERHGASLFETRGGPFKRTSGYGATCKGKRVYLHVFDQKLTTVKLPPLPAKIVTCSMLHGDQVSFTQAADGIIVTIDPNALDAPSTIVGLDLDRDRKSVVWGKGVAE